MGDLMEVHGPVSGEVAVAIITKAKDAWDGGVYLHGQTRTIRACESTSIHPPSFKRIFVVGCDGDGT